MLLDLLTKDRTATPDVSELIHRVQLLVLVSRVVNKRE